MSTHAARWFAPSGIESERNVYFRARANLEISAVPECCEIRIAAESWYRLFINGERISSGPARGTSTLAFFDTLDLAPFLKLGQNDLEVLVTCANIPTFKAAPIRPALWIETPNTSLQWQVARDGSFDAAAPLYTFQIGFCEWRDLRIDQFDWQTPEFFALDKKLLPRDCAMLEVTTHAPQQENFPVALEASGVLVLDFGREITGGAEIEIEAASGAHIEFAYAEHLDDGKVRVRYADENGENGNTFADRFIARAGRQVLGASLQERGFRFFQITNHHDQIIVVHDVRAVDRRHPLPAVNFQCDDEKMQRLYEMAHHTLSSCATDVIMDCPWREGALWTNDMVVNAPFWLAAGGDPRLVARCLRLALSERNSQGLIYGVCPNGGREEIVFLATNAFLPLMLLELSSRDENLASELLQAVGEVMAALTEYSDGDGLLVGPPEYWNFLDWSFAFNDWDLAGRASASINWFYVLALDAMAMLCRQYGREYSSWQTRAEEVAGALHARFWDAQRAQYLEFENEDKASELAQALACISKRDEKITRVLCEKLASENDWLKPELYMMHFVLRALIENGDAQAASARLLRYWGAMLDADSPTLWEANVHQHGAQAFSGWGSLCHAFSCAPLWALPRIYPLQG